MQPYPNDKFDLRTAMAILEKCDAIAVTDKSGKYIYVNQNWTDVIGMDILTLQEKHPWDIFPNTAVREVLRSKKPMIGYKMRFNQTEGFVSYYPLMEGEHLFGVFIWAQYTTTEYALQFSQRVLELSRELAATKETLRVMSTANYSLANIIGESAAIQKLRQEIIEASHTTSTVLIEGETGVGKELVAHAIHDCSARKTQRFVRVNCSAIPVELAESELFGYDEGAFTGAKKGGKKGKFELASRGSLFLDEINQLPVVIQPKLLRVLQEREFERVGGNELIPTNARIITATNVPLMDLVATGSFRSDLYYRLNVIHIKIPPLRERKEDIPSLVQNLLLKLNHDLGTDISYVENSVYELMSLYSWPGNIRELQNKVERAINCCKGDTLNPSHFDLPESGAPLEKEPPSGITPHSLFNLKSEMDYETIKEAMLKCRGNKTKAAEMLGISRTALYKKLRKYENPEMR